MEATLKRAISKRSLDERIAAAFLTNAKSDDVVALISETETSASVAAETAELSRARALDPALSTADVATARRDMEDAAFNRDRMQIAVAKLGERLRELKAQEEDCRRWAAYEKAKQERDQLAAELKEVYPVYVARLAGLLSRIDANDRELERVNTRAMPVGAPWLAGAELIARGLKGFNDGSTSIPRITRDLHLPAFEYKTPGAYCWPLQRA